MKVLVVANDHVGSRMAGPGIRSLRFATELADEHEVTLVVPFATDVDPGGVEVIQDDPWDARRMTARVRGFDVVIAQKLPVSTMRRLARGETVAIYDLYAPVTIEALAWGAQHRASRRMSATHRLNAVTQEVTLLCGDAFVCASERQRDMWLGHLLSLGRIDQETYRDDPSLRRLVDVVPFGIESAPPKPARVLRNVVPGIGTDDKVLLWGGGIWNWFDPLTVIRAVDRVSQERSDIRLYFLGLRHPNPAVPRMEMEKHAIALAEKLGLRDRVVFFNEGWVPYEERGAYYLEADLGVSAHFDDLETRFAYRTRLLDCIWAGLPIATTAGDAIGSLVEARGLGAALAVQDVDSWAATLAQLLDDDGRRSVIRDRLDEVRGELLWPRAVEPLRHLLTAATARHAAATPSAIARYIRSRFEHAVRQRGAPGAATAGLRWAMGRTRTLEERLQPPLR